MSQGLGTNLSPAGLAAVDHAESIASVGPESNCPQRLAQWTEFHRQVESLPEVERDVFDLLWYAELTQQEAADCIGISVRSVKRRWRSARLLLATELEDCLPGGWGDHLGSAPTGAQAK